MKNFVILVVKLLLFCIIMLIALIFGVIGDLFRYPAYWLKKIAEKLVPKRESH